jgi:hypothetical protein
VIFAIGLVLALVLLPSRRTLRARAAPASAPSAVPDAVDVAP